MFLKLFSLSLIIGFGFLGSALNFEIPTNSELFLMEQAEERVTKKPFGLYVSPSDSPVSPERFSGYHTGVDFEVFEDERDVEISIHAICEGKVRFVDWVSGYGGVLIQDCIFDGLPVTVLYGHLQPSSIPYKIDELLQKNQMIGVLGEGFTRETDGERKHLHLAIHRGEQLEFKGYTFSESGLESWLDPLFLF